MVNKKSTGETIVMARRKPSIRIKKTKTGLEIIKKFYDSVGKVVKQEVEIINGKKK